MNNTRILIQDGGPSTRREVTDFPNGWQKLSGQWSLLTSSAVHEPWTGRKARWDQRYITVSPAAYFDYASSPKTFVDAMDPLLSGYISAGDDSNFVARFFEVFGNTWSVTRTPTADGDIVEYYTDVSIDTVTLAGGYCRIKNAAGNAIIGIHVSGLPDTSDRSYQNLTPIPLGDKSVAESMLNLIGHGTFTIDDTTYPGDWLIESDSLGLYKLRVTGEVSTSYPVRQLQVYSNINTTIGVSVTDIYSAPTTVAVGSFTFFYGDGTDVTFTVPSTAGGYSYNFAAVYKNGSLLYTTSSTTFTEDISAGNWVVQLVYAGVPIVSAISVVPAEGADGQINVYPVIGTAPFTITCYNESDNALMTLPNVHHGSYRVVVSDSASNTVTLDHVVVPEYGLSSGFWPVRETVTRGIIPEYNLTVLSSMGDEIYKQGFFPVEDNYTVSISLKNISGDGFMQVYFGDAEVGSYYLGGSPQADAVAFFTGLAGAGDPLRIVVSSTAGVEIDLLSTTVSGGPQWLETFDSEPFPITYQISDVRNPSERRGDATRTVLLPGSKQNNRVLRHLFHSSRAWDLNRKVPAAVITNGIVVMEGHMQITRVLESPDGVLRYEVVIFGNAVNLFDRVKDKKLSDLYVSDLDHDRNPANIVASWTAGHTNGYVYPLIDYGQDFDYADISTSGGEVKKEQLYPAVYARTLVDRIFREAGYTYSSDFLTSPDFASLVLPPTSLDGSRRLTVTASVLSQRQTGSDFYWIRIWKESPLGVSTQLVTVVLDETPLVPAVVSTGPVSVEPGYKVYVAASTGSSGFDILPGSFVELVHSDGGQGSFRASLTGTQSVGPSTGNAAILFDDDATSPNYDQLGVYDTSTGKCTLMRAPFRTFLPDMTQTDFLVGLVRAFNLCVEPRRDNPLELVIEPRDYFDDDAGYYDRSVVVRDWSKRLDLSKETTYQLVPDLVAGTYVYRYDDDDDHYNKDYKERAGSVYGTREFSVDSDFVKDVSEVQLPFSATPLVTMTDTSGYATVPVSKIGTIDSSGVWQMPASIRPRLLYYKWKELPELSSWWFEGTEYTSYPYAGHVDDPFDPVRDLNFGEAGFYYYPHQGGVTLFRRFHSRQMAEVASIDSRLMTCVVKLSPLDVNSLQFNNRIFLVGQGWYRLNKIEFDPNSPLHKVELTRAVDIRLQPGMTVIK